MDEDSGAAHADVAPGDPHDAGSTPAQHIGGYLVGFALSVGLTCASFWLVNHALIWSPGVPMALAVLAVAQMGVHLVFFLHIGTGPDNTNNILALAFGVMIVSIVIAGSLWIMFHLNANMMPADMLMDLHQQH
jgi:cytochrome o ubiquinol oxidase operon protein cyoD